MTIKFKVGQWISKEDVLKLGEVRWNKFREKYKSEHDTTESFYFYGTYENKYDDNFVIIDGTYDLFWWHKVNLDKQITYETILEYIGEKEMSKFDLKTQPWFIRVSSEEESKAAQVWLFEQKLTWADGMCLVHHYPSLSFISNLWRAGIINQGKFMWFKEDEDPHKSAKEIKLSFETITKVTNVIFPETKKLVELNGKKYKKSDLEAALSKLNPVEE